MYPLKNFIVTQKFGETVTDSNGHTGIDLYQPVGTPVYAYSGGEIIEAGVINNAHGNTLYGNVVMIDHKNGYYSFYAHLDTVKVQKGMSVIEGAQIGTLGSTGNVTGPHLHFEIRNSPNWNRKNFIDPESILGEAEEIKKETITNNINSVLEAKKGKVISSILNLRSEPGYNGEILGRLNGNTEIKINGNSVLKDGLNWLPVTIEAYVAVSEGDDMLVEKVE